jgi:hypothetical protein
MCYLALTSITVLEPRVQKPGDYASAFRAETNEILTFHWNSDHNVGKKHVLSTAFDREIGRRTAVAKIAVSDEYKVMFATCDRFNRALNDRMWPHRHGAGGHVGDWLCVHDFFFSSTLQNVLNAWRSLHNPERFEFQAACTQLSEDLFQFSLTL